MTTHPRLTSGEVLVLKTHAGGGGAVVVPVGRSRARCLPFDASAGLALLVIATALVIYDLCVFLTLLTS